MTSTCPDLVGYTSCNDLSVSASVIKALRHAQCFVSALTESHAATRGNYPMTRDSISNYRTKVNGYKNASSPVNRVCGRIPRIPPESATA